jgi:hypothetical protein
MRMHTTTLIVSELFQKTIAEDYWNTYMKSRIPQRIRNINISSQIQQHLSPASALFPSFNHQRCIEPTLTTASLPFFAACINAVSPTLFRQSIHLINREARKYTTSSWPSAAASIRGVSPLLFLDTPSYSCVVSSTRKTTICLWPFSAAKWREVLQTASGL